ncbi:uncharacterized protein LOC133195035 [Saccostrea echinata]|uniref:uncharacterized protein LOC133195035 n=1 Tax=Saccostrea echinata TaxID=191078 RepID=UPI002A80CCE0|nr:uncharacterized protein LOC133195035 [Saccostrea echinata]
MKIWTILLLYVVETVSCFRFFQHICEGICAIQQEETLIAQSPVQCARHCLKNESCRLFLYHEENHICHINGEHCCSGWNAYYIGNSAPQFNSSSVLNIATPANKLNPYYSLTDYGITGTDRSYLKVDIKGCKDAHIGLSKTEMNANKKMATYEIVIGGSNNTWTYVRKSGEHKRGGSGGVDCGKFLPFWVTWDNDVIRFGRGHILYGNEILSWSDPDSSLDIKYLGLGTWNFDIDWHIYLS